jgi:peptidoglycan/xylan/chitin deacetylase (PgdA/CDA1 family)
MLPSHLLEAQASLVNRQGIQPMPLAYLLRTLLLAWLLLVPSLDNSRGVWAAALQAPVTHGPRARARVALTFDLCQVPGRPAGFDAEIVRILEEKQLAATFFAGGDWMRTHPSETRRLAANPRFEIGSHSWSHPDMRQLSRASIGEEAGLTVAELQSLTGRTTRLFRLPYGFGSERTLQALHDLGFAVIQWEVVTGDPDPKVSARDILTSVHNRTRNGSIIVMHANGRGRHTAEALPGILDELERRGFELTTVSDLLGYPVPGPIATKR